jgi:aminoglycoside 6'-N-acetyltransferase I
MLDEIRPGEPRDVLFLAESWWAMIEELGLAPAGFLPDWRARLAEHFSAGIADGSQGWFVADRNGERTGCAAAFLRASVIGEVQRRRSAVLAGVYVVPAFRRTGRARRLVTRAIEWSRERGCTQISLQTSASAEPLYRSLGFEDDRGLVLNLA